MIEGILNSGLKYVFLMWVDNYHVCKVATCEFKSAQNNIPHRKDMIIPTYTKAQKHRLWTPMKK